MRGQLPDCAYLADELLGVFVKCGWNIVDDEVGVCLPDASPGIEVVASPNDTRGARLLEALQDGLGKSYAEIKLQLRPALLDQMRIFPVILVTIGRKRA